MDLSQLGFMGNFSSPNQRPGLSGGVPSLGTPGAAASAGNGLGGPFPSDWYGITNSNGGGSGFDPSAGGQGVAPGAWAGAPTGPGTMVGGSNRAGGSGVDLSQTGFMGNFSSPNTMPSGLSGGVSPLLGGFSDNRQQQGNLGAVNTATPEHFAAAGKPDWINQQMWDSMMAGNTRVQGYNEQVSDPWATFNQQGSDVDKYTWLNNHRQYMPQIMSQMGAGFAPWYNGVDANGGATASATGNVGQLTGTPNTLSNLGSTPGVTPATTGTTTPALPPADPNGITAPSLAGQFSSTAGPLSTTPTSTNPNTNALMDVYGDPSYQFRLDQGTKALGNSYAAGGNFLSGAAAKALTNYGQNAASQEYGAAYGRMTGDRQYNLDVQRGDQNQANIDRQANFNMANTDRQTQLSQDNTNRNFNYNAALTDQTLPFNQQLSLAQLGLGATGQSAQNNAALAAILSGNTTGAGNAGAAGTVGSSNAFSGAISQMISNYLQQNLMSRIPGLLPNNGG